MKRISRRQLILLHDQMLAATGGLTGLRDEGLLDAALQAPFAGVGNTEFYPGIVAKAARLAYGVVANHPFNDGNKRTGMQAMLVMLHINGHRLSFTDEELVSLGLGLADGSVDSDGVRTWIVEHLVDTPDD